MNPGSFEVADYVGDHIRGLPHPLRSRYLQTLQKAITLFPANPSRSWGHRDPGNIPEIKQFRVVERFRIWAHLKMKQGRKSLSFQGMKSRLFKNSQQAKSLLAGLILVLLPLMTRGQDPVVPDASDGLFRCLRASFPDNGQSLDSLMATFETELIEEGLLEGSDSEDYRGLLQRIASGQALVRPVDRYFGPRFRNLPRDTSAYRKCYESIEKTGTSDGDSPLIQFETFRETLFHEQVSPALEAAAYLDLLTAGDLRHPYYRLFIYELIDRQAYETEFAPPSFATLEQMGRLNTQGANVFRVYMNEEDQMIVSDQLVTPAQMLELVSRHARTYEQSALYTIQVEADVKYGNFIALKDRIALAITEVRDQYARRVLGKTLTELTVEERDAVSAKYPIRIVSP